ncbi:hypothetical protein BD414DRAFT_120731 [Trametes punicea]|nr:hypothetical protein BD414DRAFT_120731 [Trametes punicea]
MSRISNSELGDPRPLASASHYLVKSIREVQKRALLHRHARVPTDTRARALSGILTLRTHTLPGRGQEEEEKPPPYDGHDSRRDGDGGQASDDSDSASSPDTSARESHEVGAGVGAAKAVGTGLLAIVATPFALAAVGLVGAGALIWGAGKVVEGVGRGLAAGPQAAARAAAAAAADESEQTRQKDRGGRRGGRRR